jgi:hypothetical protein
MREGLLLVHILKDFVEDLFGHIEGKAAELSLEPPGRIEEAELRQAAVLAEIFDVFGQVCEVVELGVEFWIFPGILLA